ncbi:MAG: hypothetical protein ACRC2K_03345 [Clostridium sp.]
MKQKKTLLLGLVFLMLLSVPAFGHDKKEMGAIFMGEVQEVQKNEKDNNLMVKVKGYIKGCKVYEEELIAIISENTIVLPKECPNKKEIKFEKTNPMELQIEKGDSVFIVLNEAMTKSIPPQAGAKAIQITHPDEN